MKVSIVTEGFQSTGYGHITRCLSLYQAFEEKQITPTFFVNGDENAFPFLSNSNHKIINWLGHPTKLFSEIKNSDVLIIDSYLAGKEYYETFSKLCKVSLFVDDNLRLDYPEGIILNGTINSENFSYKKKAGCSYLLGSKYIPIRKEFWDNPQRKFKNGISSFLITFGGQDIRNLTLPVLKTLRDQFPGAKKNVVFGSNNGSSTGIEKYTDTNTKLFFSLNAGSMKELMLTSDIVITAAGQTLYELAVTGTPAIAVAVAENQKSNILEWKKKGFLLDSIFHNDKSYLRKISEQISTLQTVSQRKKLSGIGKECVDGQGARRIVKYLIEKICNEKSFYIRRAVQDDSKIIFDLSNDPSVRVQSINQNQIEWEEHQKWFSKKLTDNNYIFFLVFDKEDNFIGQVKFELGKETAVVSISLTQDFRGIGLSKKILIDAAARIFSSHNIKNIIAYIRPENTASIMGFKSAEFKSIGRETINGESFLKYVLER
ncbi:MAG: UDP-2,4-diacetamido-2,4,6-trideoxy-beta-L-altropyranose hydrolase [Ignavibacteriales bacterium]|nr:UDP-2,4-diacetamido-2,4,6-trideoxy-beta-L-altropyranose hydrolase [Ignavibacteriales bacterium]